jgi:hypothetical protein
MARDADRYPLCGVALFTTYFAALPWKLVIAVGAKRRSNPAFARCYGLLRFARAGGQGSRAVLEVRSREVPFILEHGQIVGRLVYEKMLARPDALYGQRIGSNYQVTRNRNGVLLTSPACGEVDARNRSVLQLRDGGIVPLICPTCQMLSRSLKASAPATPSYFAWGCFRYFSWERGGSGETLTACSGLAPPSQPSPAIRRRGAAAQVARPSSHVIAPPPSRPASRARPRCRHRRPPAGRPACRFAPRPDGPAPRPCH